MSGYILETTGREAEASNGQHASGIPLELSARHVQRREIVIDSEYIF